MGVRIPVGGWLRRAGERHHTAGRISGDAFSAEREGVLFDPISWEVDLLASPPFIDARLRAETTAELRCDRCLAPIRIPLQVESQERYAPREAWSEEREAECDAAGIAFRPLPEDGAIDVEPGLREALWLALPWKRLCRPDCLGICPHCGRDRNVAGRCECREEELDPRLAKLREWFSQPN